MTKIVLLVEDNDDHAELVNQVLEDENIDMQVHWARDGQAALDYLYRKGKHADAPRPSLILLDINMPKKTGLEVLKEVKSDAVLRVIPVVMLTTSDREVEMQNSYLFGANSFITKPVRFNDYIEKIRSLERYWLLTNRFPNFNGP